jgi:hypothetical protein
LPPNDRTGGSISLRLANFNGLSIHVALAEAITSHNSRALQCLENKELKPLKLYLLYRTLLI